MSALSPSDTLNTHGTELRYRGFESAWLRWHKGQPIPDWRKHLPAAQEPCHPDLIAELLQVDIECRIKAGLSALLSERYFEHPRLQQPDARLSAEQQIELIRWECQQRRQNGQPASSRDYQSAFPQFADALSELQPDSRRDTVRSLTAAVPSFVPPLAPSSRRLDLRGYELIEQLGKGGMGAVYRAVDPALGRDLAVKVMAAELRGDAQHERRFLREAQVTGALQHPGIVPIYNLGRLADGRLHYTMRLVRGQTFAALLKDNAGKPEHWPELLNVFVRICQAVAYAHSKRVIHRDLKPANVMVGKFGEVQVMDWGLAKVLTAGERGCVSAPCTDTSSEDADTALPGDIAEAVLDLSRLGRPMGTLAYMPPEQALGAWDTVDERADVFALGAILCEMLTGDPPYWGEEFEELLRRAQQGDVSAASFRLEQCKADAALVALCRECLSAEREGRPRDAGEVAQRVVDHQAEVQARLRQAELERVAAEAGAREAVGRMEAERRASRRLLGLAAAIVVFVLMGAAGLAVAMLAVRAEQKRTQTEQKCKQAALDQVENEQRKTQAALEEAQAEQRRTWATSQQVTSEELKTQKAWQQTREALNTLTDDLMEQFLGKQKELDQREKEFLRRVIGFYQHFASEQGTVEQSRAVAAEGQARVAKLRAFLGEHAEAEAGYRAAAGLYEKLIRDFPGEPRYRQELAKTHHNLSRMLGRLGRNAEAEKAFHLALTPIEQLARDFPNTPQYRIQLAVSLGEMGNFLHKMGRLAEAEEAIHQARRLQEKLARDFPRVPRLRQDLAASWSNLNLLLAAQGRTAEAEPAQGQARALLENLVRDYPSEPGYRHGLSSVYCNWGDQLVKLGRRTEADSAYRQALWLQEKLVQDFPAIPDYRDLFAILYVHRGALLSELGRTGEAEKAIRQAQRHEEQLARDFPTVPKYREVLALSHSNLSTLLSGLGRRTEAESAYRQALTLQEQLTREYPNVPAYRNHLARSHDQWANQLERLGRREDAETVYGKALTLYDKLAREFPTVVEHRLNLAHTYVNIGSVRVKRGHFHASLAWFAKAIPMLQAILAQDARIATARSNLRTAHVQRARALVQLRRHAEAANDWLRAIELDEGKERGPIRFHYGLAQLNAGNVRAAVQGAEQLAASSDAGANAAASATPRFHAARIYALAAAKIKDDDFLREQYAARAIALLRQVQKTGFFNDPQRAADLRKDSFLGTLRGRDDFRTFLSEIK